MINKIISLKSVLITTVLLVVLFASAAYSEGLVNQINNQPVDIEFRNITLKDAVSALAYRVGATVIMEENVSNQLVNYTSNKVRPLHAIEILAKRNGLEMIKKDNIIILVTAGESSGSLFNESIRAKFTLNHLTGKAFNDTLGGKDGNSLGITIYYSESQPRLMYAVGKPAALATVRDIVASCDVPEARGTIKSRSLKINNIEPGKAIDIMRRAGVSVNTYVSVGNNILVFDNVDDKTWQRGVELLKQFDQTKGGNVDFITHRLRFASAINVANKLKSFGIGQPGAVNTMVAGDKSYSKDLMITCDKSLMPQVKAALNTIDKPQNKIKIAFAIETGEGAYSRCKNKRTRINKLVGIPLKNMPITFYQGSGTRPWEGCYTLWIIASPAKILEIQGYMDVI